MREHTTHFDGCDCLMEKISTLTAKVKRYENELKDVEELKSNLANLQLNYDIRVKEIQELNDNSSEDKWNYWRKMYTTARDEFMFIRRELVDAKRMFLLILVPPIDEPKTINDYKSLWQRDKNDAKNGIRAIDEAFERLK